MTLQQEEAKVEAHSAALKKELGVRDLVLTQILFIIGLTWIARSCCFTCRCRPWSSGSTS